MDIVSNEEVRRRSGIIRELPSRVEQRVLRWFGHVESRVEQRVLRWFGHVESRVDQRVLRWFGHVESRVDQRVLRWFGRVESRVDQRVLRWFGHVERMYEHRVARRVLRAKVSVVRVRGRQRLGWMVGVKAVLGNRGMTGGSATMHELKKGVESPGACVDG